MTRTLAASAAVDTASSSESVAAEIARAPVGQPWRASLGVGSVIVALAAGGWGLSTVIRAPATQGLAQEFTVVRRSFPVVEEIKGELKAAKTTDIKSKVEGRATIIWLIEEGVTVAEGNLLVELASDQIEEQIKAEEASEKSAIAALEAAEKELEILIDQNASDIRKAELALEMAGTERQKYIEGDAEKAFMDARLGITRAEQMQARTKLDFDAAKSLREQEFITESDLLQNEFSLHEAERSLEKARLSLVILEKYTHPMELRRYGSDVSEKEKDLERVKKSGLAREAQKRADVSAKQANLMHTEDKLKKYREQRGYTKIRAPSPGLVVYYTGHRWDPQRMTEGSDVRERQTLVTLPDPSVMVVSVRIHEAKTSKVQLGQKVNIEIEGVPGTVFTGAITKIAPLADSLNKWLNPDLKEYETEITLEQNDPGLKPGMTARCEIIITQLENVLAVPLQAVFSKGGRQYVFRPDGGEGDPVEVTLGASNVDYVEVASGLNEGDRVLLAISDGAKRNLPEVEPVSAMVGPGAGKGSAPKAGAKPPASRRRPSGGGAGHGGRSRRRG